MVLFHGPCFFWVEEDHPAFFFGMGRGVFGVGGNGVAAVGLCWKWGGRGGHKMWIDDRPRMDTTVHMLFLYNCC